MRTLRLVPILLSCCLAQLAGVEVQATAASHVQAGLVALRASDNDPSQSVPAALAFAQALDLYRKAGDVDGITEMQANIFWCRKRMSMEQLQAYIASRKDDAPAAATIQAELLREVPASEATAMLQRAKEWRTAHPEAHLQAVIRFSEVVDRFQGTEQAATAQTAYNAANLDYLKEVQKEREAEKADLATKRKELDAAIVAVRQTRFQRPRSVLAERSTPVPSAADRDHALTQLKASYAKDYAKKKDFQRRALSRRLFAESEQNRSDANLYYVMLDESLRLATETEDYDQLLNSIELLGATYQGIEVTALTRSTLTRIKSKPVANAILVLLDKPDDATANTTTGKCYCFQLGRWDDGVAMLAQGSDAELRKLAGMETAKPATSSEQEQTGNAWLALGRKGGSDKVAMHSRAQYWFTLAVAGATGVRKAQLDKLMIEVDKVLPAVITDWNNVTLSQWEKLKGQLISVPSKVDRSGTGVTMKPGMRLRVVPHPDDREDIMVLVGKGDRQVPGIIEGEGVLWIEPTYSSYYYNYDWTTGARRKRGDQLRMKLVPVTGDE